MNKNERAMEERKENLFKYIKKYHKKNGFMPTFREMSIDLGYGLSSIYTYIGQLEVEKKIKCYYIDGVRSPRAFIIL